MKYKNRTYNELKDTDNYFFQFRMKKNLSQSDMAQELEVSQSYYSKVENGKMLPDFNFLKNLRLKFNVNINKVVEDA